MIYCPECAAQNPEEALFCQACGKALPLLNSLIPAPPGQFPVSITSPVPGAPQPVYPPVPPTLPTAPIPEPRSGWENLPPHLRAALVTVGFSTLLDIIAAVIPGLGFIFSVPFNILLNYIQGVLAGRYTRTDPRYTGKSFFMQGVISALWTSVVFSTIVSLIIVAIQIPLSAGVLAAVIPVIIAQSLFDIAINIVFSGLGAWLYGRLGGKKMIGISIGIIGCGTLILLALALILLVALALLGFTLASQIINGMTTIQ